MRLQTIHEIKNNEVELLISVKNYDSDVIMKNHHTKKWKCGSGAEVATVFRTIYARILPFCRNTSFLS